MKRVLRYWLLPVLLMLAAATGHAQLTGDFTASDTAGCVGLQVTFTADNAGSPTNFAWNLGNSSSPANSSVVTTTYTNPGIYTVQLTASNSGGSATTTKTGYIRIYAKPTVSFTASPTTGCVPLTVNFTAAVSPNSWGQESYDWDFGDNSTHSSLANPQHIYTQSGNYNVSLTVVNQIGCSRTFTRNLYIQVNAQPIATFSISPANYACTAPATFTFTNTTSGTGPFSTTWYFGDGSPSVTTSSLTQTHTYSTGGAYPVKMITTDANGCRSADTARDIVSLFSANASFTGPSAACVNTLVTFNNTTTGGTSASWDYGDAVSDGTGVHAYTAAGTYTVKLSVMVGQCPKTYSQSITINPSPVPTVTFSPQRPCPGSTANPSPVMFTVTSTPPGGTVTWTDFGDGSPSASGSPITHNYTSLGYKTVKLTVTSAAGCPATVEYKDFVPINGIIPHITGADSSCIGEMHTLGVYLDGTLPPAPTPPPYPDLPNSWNWTIYDVNPPPTTSTLATPTYTWNTVGEYLITVNGTTPNGVAGCTWSTTAKVYVDTKVPADFTASPTTVCPKDTVYFVNTTVNNTPNTRYTWNTGDSNFTTPVWTSGFKYLYKIPGTYTVSLTTNHKGCTDRKIRTQYITVNPSNAAFNFLVDCPPTYKAYFTDMSVGATSWLWDFGDGSPITAANTAQNPTHSYAAIGVYNVKLRTSNNVFGCTDEITKPVTVFDPILDIVASKDTFCLGEDVTLTGSFVGVGAATYSWIIDSDPPTIASSNPVITYTFTTRGPHIVKLVVNYGNNCQATFTKLKTIFVSKPNVAFNASPAIGCNPLYVTFTDASTATPGTTITGRDWDFGDGSFNNGNNIISPPPHLYNFNGAYNIKIKVTDSRGCAEELNRPGLVQVRKPVAAFSATKTTLCVHANDTFANTSTGVTPLSFFWDFGDGTTSRVKNPVHAFPAAGTYVVKMAAIDSTPCTDTARITVTVLGPHASFTKNKQGAICPPLVVSFTNTSVDATIYSWNMGNGTSPLLTFQPLNYTYNTAGKYIVTLTATDAIGCSDMAKDSVYVLGDSSSFSYTPINGCVPQTVTFTAVIDSIPKITWDFNDGTVVTVFNARTITHTYLGSGPYYPIAYFSDGTPNCNTPAFATVPIRLDKIKAAFTNSVPCVGVPFTLSDASTAVYNNPNSWQWIFGAADTSVGATTSHTFNTSGQHPVTLIATNSWGCKDTFTRNVLINPLPNIDAGPPDTGICPGDRIMLIGHGGRSYVWSPANLVSCTACDTTWVSEAKPTTYYVVGTDTNGCVNRDSIVAHIQIQTTTSVKAGGEICIGESYRLEAGGATVYNWSPERFLDSPHISSPLATPIITTTYVLEAQEGTCLVHYDSVTVVVHPAPYFDAGPDEIINYGASVMLHPTRGGIKSIEWRTDTTLSCLDCFDPVAKPTYTTRYYATATSEFGCKATDSLLVKVLCNGDSVFIPNTFTPNGDGLNDYFFPRGKGVDHLSSFRIYNRWGELVFERGTMPINDEKSGWDGTFKGAQLAPDVYMYTMTSRCENGDPVSWKGDITLIR